ncbi:hypothetical protein J1N35_042681 [Gossypium stocksii]|uniref:Uncharacterized protein n=1 Tax=Gossypium stocksii TaxID=47602 RepID=A0A9D3U602_9ROSI|nr:hypothetical protein J1N35_042681 [Gossypium stocksii]
MDNMVECSFFFCPVKVSLLHSLFRLHFRHCTKFELIAACLWCCRTIAMNLDPDEQLGLAPSFMATYTLLAEDSPRHSSNVDGVAYS